ncbi:MAG TPA: hypothetical protein VJY66_00500, partial [Acholeplasma sp.]|nr:hypothetical protein [Acholeplasma sp.]
DLEAVAALVCTPSILSYYEDKAKKYRFNTGFFYERKIAYYETICPLIHFDRLKSTKIFMGCGLNDIVVSPTYAKALKSKLSDKTLMFYDTGHVSTSEMLEDSYQFLKEVLTYGTIG